MAQEEKRNVRVAHEPEPIAKPAEAIRGHGAKDDGNQGSRHGGDDGIGEPFEKLLAHRAFLPDQPGAEAEAVPALPFRGVFDEGHDMTLHDIWCQLEAGGDGPVDREQAYDRPQDQDTIDRHPARIPFRLVGKVLYTLFHKPLVYNRHI